VAYRPEKRRGGVLPMAIMLFCLLDKSTFRDGCAALRAAKRRKAIARYALKKLGRRRKPAT